MMFALRVTTGQERIIANMLDKKVKDIETNDIYSVIYVDGIKGYLFVEAESENAIPEITYNMRYVKGYIKKPVSEDEIKKLLSSIEEPTAKIKMGDIVELVSGPFKGEKAKVIKIDEDKDESTVELIEVAVPIPVTVKLKILKKVQTE